MADVSIILSTRQCTGNNDVEVTGECEKEYNQLALYAFAANVIKKAKECGGTTIPWSREGELQQFCYAFRFGTEKEKKEFLKKLYESS